MNIVKINVILKNGVQGHSGLCKCTSEGDGIKSLRANGLLILLLLLLLID